MYLVYFAVHYPSNIASIYHNNLNQLSVVDIQGLGVYLKNINIINSTGIDLQFLLNWINNKVSPDSECSLLMDNIHWTNVNPSDLIVIGQALVGMGQIGSDGYVYALNSKPVPGVPPVPLNTDLNCPKYPIDSSTLASLLSALLKFCIISPFCESA